MTERERIIERLRAVDLGGGSHESLSAIAKAVYEPVGGWTIGACEQLRQTLVRLLGEADTPTSGGCITDEPSQCRHHHAPTVEDVLREFAEGLGVPVADSYIATSAAKLRLAGGDAE